MTFLGKIMQVKQKKLSLYNLDKMINRKKRGATIKKRKTKSHSKTYKYDPRNMTILFGGGILVGIIIMGFIASNWFEVFQKNSTDTIALVSNEKKTKDPESRPIENISENKFDFYTLLPRTGASAESTTSTSTQSKKRTLDLQQSAPTYVVQVGSFKNVADADELRAQLTLQGYTAHSQQIRLKSGQYWYRVSIGPFKSHKSALEQQKLLEGDKFTDTLLVLQQK